MTWTFHLPQMIKVGCSGFVLFRFFSDIHLHILFSQHLPPNLNSKMLEGNFHQCILQTNYSRIQIPGNLVDNSKDFSTSKVGAASTPTLFQEKLLSSKINTKVEQSMVWAVHKALPMFYSKKKKIAKSWKRFLLKYLNWQLNDPMLSLDLNFHTFMVDGAILGQFSRYFDNVWYRQVGRTKWKPYLEIIWQQKPLIPQVVQDVPELLCFNLQM